MADYHSWNEKNIDLSFVKEKPLEVIWLDSCRTDSVVKNGIYNYIFTVQTKEGKLIQLAMLPDVVKEITKAFIKNN